MTAENAGKAAVQGIWATLRTVREQWALIVFVTGALFWARDTWEQISGLPAAVDEIAAGVEALAGRIADLDRLAGRVGAIEAAIGPQGQVRGDPVLLFPGTRHSAGDALPGGWSDVRLDPVRVAGRDCAPMKLDAFVIDATGRWFETRATIGAPPALEFEGDLAFGVQLPASVPPGRAAIALSFLHECGAGLAVSAVPHLPLRVLGN